MWGRATRSLFCGVTVSDTDTTTSFPTTHGGTNTLGRRSGPWMRSSPPPRPPKASQPVSRSRATSRPRSRATAPPPRRMRRRRRWS